MSVEPKVRTITSTDYQRSYAEAHGRVLRGHHLIVTQHGRPQFAVIDIQEYRQLIEARRFLAVVNGVPTDGRPASTEGAF